MKIAWGARSGGPHRAVIDSRLAGEGDLFVGLPGEQVNGGQFAAAALRAGAWGALVTPEHAAGLDAGPERVIEAADPLAELQGLAREWRRSLSCQVLGITGSTGKTSVKDIAAAMLPGKVHASPENYNTEIGLPLAILAAPEDTEVLALEMAMRGSGQIGELREIAEPDVAVITNVGPVHVELLGSVEAIAAAKAEILDGLRGAAVVQAHAGPLEQHLGKVRYLLRFGDGGDVFTTERLVSESGTDALVQTPSGSERFRFPFSEAYNVDNALAAVAAGLALDLPLAEMAVRAPGITFSRLRGDVVHLPNDAILINDSYNANPVSMRAALDHLSSLQVGGRRIAVLGEMRELGGEATAHHREVGAHARLSGADLVIGVGDLADAYEPDRAVGDAEAAARLLETELRPGDAVLIKGSRAIGLERVAEVLAGEEG